MSELEQELKKLYDSEINVSITSFWDGGWRVALGDELNGFKRPNWDTCELHEIVDALQKLALEYYPDSTYSKNLIDKLVEKLTVLGTHDLLHLPIKHYGFDKNGTQVLTKEVHRRNRECARCDELYKDLPVPTQNT